MPKKKYELSEIEISKNFPSGISTHIDWKPLANIIECEHSLVIEIELPGVDKKDISVTLQNNQELVIRGVKRQPRLEKNHVTYYLFEREFGTFYKRILIDFPIEPKSIDSSMENGVLTIEIRKSESHPVAVEIK